MLNIVVLGSGGREYAIIDKLIQDSNDELYYPLSNIYFYPRNDALLHNYSVTTLIPDEYCPTKEDNYLSFINYCKKNSVDLVIIGPEQHLVNGIVNYLNDNEISAFGPDLLSSKLEGSKVFAKKYMSKNNIPTSPYELSNINLLEKSKKFINNNWKNNKKYVLKVDGLASGKGVFLPHTKEECITTLEDLVINKKYGKSSEHIIIEERLDGEEISILGFCNGYDISFMPPTQDYKKIYDGDKGLNTGGMGCHSPVNTLNPDEIVNLREWLLPLIKEFQYKGVLKLVMVYMY